MGYEFIQGAGKAKPRGTRAISGQKKGPVVYVGALGAGIWGRGAGVVVPWGGGRGGLCASKPLMPSSVTAAWQDLMHPGPESCDRYCSFSPATTVTLAKQSAYFIFDTQTRAIYTNMFV